MTTSPDSISPDLGATGEPRALRYRGRLPRVSIHVLIVFLMLALIAPAAIFLGLLVDGIGKEREEEVSQQGDMLSEDIAERLELEFQTSATLLAVFASSGWLEEGEYALLHQRARRALAGTDRYLIVLDEDFRQLLNTRVEYGTPVGKTSNVPAAAEVLESGGLIVSDLFRGGVAGTTVFNVMRRASLPDGATRALILTRNADDLRTLFGQAIQSEGWSFAILDAAGQVALEAIDATQPNESLPSNCLEPAFGFRTLGEPDSEKYVFNKSVGFAPWRICVWGSTEYLLSRAGSYWDLYLSATVVWFFTALAAAIALSTGISRAVSDTARVGGALDAGKPVNIAPSFIAEVDDVRHSLANAAAERLRKDEERQVMMRETAHRAKNQMALAVSLISLSARSAESVQALKSDVTERLVAVGRSVDVLASRHGAAASLGRLIRLQLDPFVDEGMDRLSAEGPETLVSERAAQSLSLVLHELATNASKYGGWSVPEGSVTVVWTCDGDTLVLDWRETPGTDRQPGPKGFGTTLVDGLIERNLEGSIERSFDGGGFGCRIVLPVSAIAATGGRRD